MWTLHCVLSASILSEIINSQKLLAFTIKGTISVRFT